MNLSKKQEKQLAFACFGVGLGPQATKRVLEEYFFKTYKGNGTISSWFKEFKQGQGQVVEPVRMRPKYFPTRLKERALEMMKAGSNWREIVTQLACEFPNDSIPSATLVYKWRKRWIGSGHLDKASLPVCIPRPGRPSQFEREFVSICEKPKEPTYNEQLAKMSKGELERQADILLYGSPNPNKSKYIVNPQRFTANYHPRFPYSDIEEYQQELEARAEMTEVWEKQAAGITMPETEYWDDDDIPAISTRRRRTK